MVRRLAALTLTLAVLALACAGTLVGYLDHWASQLRPLPSEGIIFELKPGTPSATLAQQLTQLGLVDASWKFHLWVRLQRDYGRYQAGKYKIEGPISPKGLAAKLKSGETFREIILQVTVPEGWTSQSVIERLAAHRVGHIVELRRLLTDRAFLDRLKIPSSSLEGFLYPATYPFAAVPTPVQALSVMVETFWKNLPSGYETAAKAKGLNLAQAVTFASLIELETRLDDERPLIAEVIWNRLRTNMPLGIDAAIIYGVDDYDGSLRSRHLVDKGNPYNTRIHLGLPPTPIGSPSRKSLEAVLTPTDFGHFYYVLVQGEGRHHFSKSLAEHNLHVKKLVEATKRAKAKAKAGAGGTATAAPAPDSSPIEANGASPPKASEH